MESAIICTIHVHNRTKILTQLNDITNSNSLLHKTISD